MTVVLIAIACGLAAVLYGIITSRQVLASPAGSERMIDVASAIQEGAKAPRRKGLSKKKAVEAARRLVEKKARPALVLVHKTRYIIERQLQFSA